MISRVASTPMAVVQAVPQDAVGQLMSAFRAAGLTVVGAGINPRHLSYRLLAPKVFGGPNCASRDVPHFVVMLKGSTPQEVFAKGLPPSFANEQGRKLPVVVRHLGDAPNGVAAPSTYQFTLSPKTVTSDDIASSLRTI